MPETFSGGCACGAVRYESKGAPRYMGNCHCIDCQKATGGPYLPAVMVRLSDFAVTKGEPRMFESPADAGHPMHRAFCGDCGSPVFLINEGNPKVRVIYAGSLDDPSWYEPSRDIYTVSAQPWDLMHPDLPKHEGMPQR
jgi:hypothetical protein